MELREAVSLAKQYVQEAFAGEGVINLGLEEIEQDRDTGEWSITIGFSRSWDRPRRPAFSPVLRFHDEELPAPLNREYRVVKIGPHGEVLSVRLRDIAA